MTSKTRILMSLIYAAFVVYVFVPLTLMVVMSFKDSKFIGFPIKSWTMDWYVGLLENTEILGVFTYSTGIAIASTLVSIFVGTWIVIKA